jgi:5-methylcytosine-specific restriction endonuclease McrA
VISTREKVERRANGRCEYCQAPQGICAYTFHVEHITPRSKGGANSLANYALACFPCNNAKGAHLVGIDPDSGEEVGLFHPRKQKWADHFAWTKKFSQIKGKTPTGRATVARLKMNERLQVKARPLWIETGIWP